MKFIFQSRYNGPLLAITLAFAAALPAFAQDTLLNVPTPDVAAELQAFEVAEGFEVNLFAADPMFANPIHMNFDAEGRLWVVGSAVYPHIAPGQAQSDSITVLEDTDGDGMADKSTVFADNLFIPTGVVPGDGGVYAANSTELLHLKDTDGDGRADETRVVLSGFGTEDTHHILHSLRWGFDGLMYFNQSIYIHSHIETPHGVRRLNAGGIWQFRPDTMELEVFVRGFVNPWGYHYDRWGQSFATDGAYHEGINYIFPGAAFLTVNGVPRILKGLNEGTPKHCGLEVLSGRHLPKDWQGSMITHDFRGQRVCRFVVTEEGGSYVSVEQPAVLKSTHVSFRPVDVKMGPDGAIYVADWYNPIIQHGEVDFRDPRRDREHGRIWRITAKNRPLVERPEIGGAPIEDLIALTRAPEEWNRVHAKQELKHGDRQAVLDALEAALLNLDPAAADFENARLELLWTFQTLDAVNAGLLDTVLASQDHRARAAAVRVLAQWKTRLNDDDAYYQRLVKLVEDDHPRVRLEALRALALLPRTSAAEIAMGAMDLPMDRFVEYALWVTMRDLKDQWLPKLEGNEKPDFASDNAKLLYALKALDSGEAVAPLLRLYGDTALAPDQQREALAGIVNHGSAASLGEAVAHVLAAETADPEHRARLLQDIVTTGSRRFIRPGGDLSKLEGLILSAPEALRLAAVNAVGAWRVDTLRPVIETLAQDGQTPTPIRLGAIDAAAALGGESAQVLLVSLTGAGESNETRLAAIRALLRLSPDTAAQQTVTALGEMTGINPEPLFQAFLQADGGVAALIKSLNEAAIPAEMAKLGLRTVSASGRNEPDLLTALRSAGGLGEAISELSPERMAELVNAVRTHGDPARGYEHYRKLDCAQCHAIAGGGGALGPDMTSIGGSAQSDYLIESMLFPDQAIKEGFHSLVVETADLETYSGIKAGETDTEVILRSATVDEIRIPKDQIESMTDGGSLMPSGLTDTLLENEFIDLIAFLSELGRTPAYSAGTERRVRTWRVLDDTQAARDYLYEAQPEAAIAPHDALSWLPAYSHVNGTLPLNEVPVLAHSYWVTRHSFLQFTIDANSSGTVALAIAPREGVRLWLNGQPIELNGEIILTGVPAGQSACTLILDRSVAQGELDVRLVDDPRATVTARFLGGR